MQSAIAAVLISIVFVGAQASPLAVYPGATSDPDCLANPVSTDTQTRVHQERRDGVPGEQCGVRSCDQERNVHICAAGAPPLMEPWTDVSCGPWDEWPCGDDDAECRVNPVSTSTETRWVPESVQRSDGRCNLRECEETRTRYECAPPQGPLYDPWAPTGTCGAPTIGDCVTQPPPQCGSLDTEGRVCPTNPNARQTRSRPLLVDGDPCVWGTWSGWSPVCPPLTCTPPSEVQTRVCASPPAPPSTTQERTRVQSAQGGSCRWDAWSVWSDCPTLPVCPSPATETRSCATDPLVQQTRTRTSGHVGAVCQWGPWSAWAPDCPAPPPSCHRTQSQTQVCPDDATVIQTRSRAERPDGDACVWNAWSDWTPDCPAPPAQCISPGYAWSESDQPAYDGRNFYLRLRQLGYTPCPFGFFTWQTLTRRKPHLGGNSWGPFTEWRMDIGNRVQEGHIPGSIFWHSIYITESQLGLSPIPSLSLPCLAFCAPISRTCRCPGYPPEWVSVPHSYWSLASGADPNTAVPDGPWVIGLSSCP